MDRLVESVTRSIAEGIQPEKIILFGSRARGDADPESDIDLLLICKDFTSRRDLKLRVRDLFAWPDFSMDLFVLTPEEFERQKDVVSTVGRIASREGVVCYDRKTERH